jgi:L-asparagine transporter-like permease
MKIIAIIFFLATSIYVLAKENVGISKWQEAGGPFLGKSTGEAIKNTLSVMIAATFSFGGTEMVGIVIRHRNQAQVLQQEKPRIHANLSLARSMERSGEYYSSTSPASWSLDF